MQNFRANFSNDGYEILYIKVRQYRDSFWRQNKGYFSLIVIFFSLPT